MARLHTEIDERLADFIRRQHVFFVGTAPLDPHGHVNVSPKGLDTFAILGPRSVAYLDLTGSGIETAAHVRENGRIVVLFCSFDAHPALLRLHGRGEVVDRAHPEFAALRARFPESAGGRCVVRIAVERIADSCGMGVPRYTFEGDRADLPRQYAKGSAETLERYWAANNRTSIDGLPGLD